MSIPDLKNALYEGTVLFEFIKKDGTNKPRSYSRR